MVIVADTSPCAACADALLPGTVSPNAEIQPYVAVSPSSVGTPRVNVIGVGQQDRSSKATRRPAHQHCRRARQSSLPRGRPRPLLDAHRPPGLRLRL